jgi:hypothetical protein
LRKRRERGSRRPKKRKYSRGPNQDSFVTEINVAIEYNVCKLSRIELTVPQCRLSLDLNRDYLPLARQYNRRGETAVCIILSLMTDHGMGTLL